METEKPISPLLQACIDAYAEYTGPLKAPKSMKSDRRGNIEAIIAPAVKEIERLREGFAAIERLAIRHSTETHKADAALNRVRFNGLADLAKITREG